MYQKTNSSIVPKGAINSFKEMFPVARMFPLAVMHRVLLGKVRCNGVGSLRDAKEYKKYDREGFF